MIPLHLKLSGFLSYCDQTEVDFSSFDLACISGQNGAGKSSLLDAMTWSLFGQARKRDEALINMQSKIAEVAFIFAYEGNIYRVLRSLPRGKGTSLEFQIADGGNLKLSITKQKLNWRPLTEHTIRETQARIEKVLRLDYDTFINVSFFLQGHADQFAQQPPTRRKEILGNILGLEIWEIYKERTAERRKVQERELDLKDGQVTEIDSELAEEDSRKLYLKDLEERLKQISFVRQTQETALASLRKAAASHAAAEKARLEEEKRTLEEQKKTVNDQAATVEELTSRIESGKQSLEEVEGKIEKRKDLGDKRSNAREESAKLRAENETLKTIMDELKARIEKLKVAKGATCPLCGQTLSEEHRQSTLTQLTDEGKEKGDRFRGNKTKMDDLEARISNLDSQITKLENAEKERLVASNSITQLTERLEAIKKSITNWEAAGAKRLEEVEASLASEKYAIEAQKPIANLDEAEKTLFDLQERENQLNQEVGAARQKVTVLDELRKRKKKLEVERGELGLQIGRYKTLERAFGKDGVPALLIEQALPEIEMKANEILGRLSDDTMRLHFETQAKYKDDKRKDLRETLEIQVSDEAGVRDYEMFSGGEAFRVNFAIRLALSEVLAQRKGARLQMLVIDEGFGSQDAQGRQRLIQSINAVRADFAKILVITHLDELKDSFPTRIEVEKTESGSTVRIV